MYKRQVEHMNREDLENKAIALDDKANKLMRAIDAINSISGRASMGHDSECDCTLCLIHNVALKAWTNL